jgi:hypothetical protein
LSVLRKGLPDCIAVRGNFVFVMSVDRSGERRRLAAECLAAAKTASDYQARAVLLEMAQKWLEAAERSEHEAWNESLRLRALEAAIGLELQAFFELPQQLPHRLLTLLMQLNTDGCSD